MLDRFDQVTAALLTMVEPDVVVGLPPPPLLAAYHGDEPIAIATLRPFGPGEVVDALIEVLALLLPLGADRVALALPARVWSSDDPDAGEVGGADLRRTAVAVTTVDGTGPDGPVMGGSLHPYGIDDHGGHGWLVEGRHDDLDAPEGPATDALRCLVGGRAELAGQVDTTAVALQFARCLLRGHGILLAPDVARRLETATTAGAASGSGA